MKSLALILILTLMAGTLYAAGLNQDSPWPKFRHDLKNTGHTRYTGPANPTLAWTFPTNESIASSPSIGPDGTIYFGSGWHFLENADSSLYAINPDGTLKWKFKTGNGIFSSPAIGDDGTIYVGSVDKYLYAIEDSVTYGKMRWRSYLSMFLLSSPSLADDGAIYMGSPNFRFWVINPDGTSRWRYQTGWCIISSAAVIEDGTIYIGSKDHNLYAFDEALEGPRWQYTAGTFFDGHLVDASPAVGPDGTIYVGTDQYGAAGQIPIPVDTSFRAVNPDGTLKWAFETGDGVESSAALGPDGTIYFGSFDSCLYAVADSGTYGRLKWKFKTNGPVDGSPTVDGDGNIYFGSRDSVIYALYPDGSIKWTCTTGGGIESSPTIDDKGYLYIGSFDGRLYKLGTGAPDVGAVSIDFPARIIPSETYLPRATFRNFRSAPQSLDALCEIDTGGVIIYSETITISDFPDGAEELYPFTPWVAPADSGIQYKITVKTILPTDENTENDSLSRSFATYVCGDTNGDNDINVGDAVFVINYIFNQGPSPQPLPSGDVNCDGIANIGDPVYLINYIFRSGPVPCAGCSSQGN